MVNTWQLISVNINRPRSSDISVIKEKLFCPAHARALSAILSIQETYSWDVPNLGLPGYVCYGSKSGFASLLVSEQFCTVKRSWKFAERCTAILFGTTLVMAAYAPDSGKTIEMYEAFISSVLNVLREGLQGGAKDFNNRREGHRGAE